MSRRRMPTRPASTSDPLAASNQISGAAVNLPPGNCGMCRGQRHVQRAVAEPNQREDLGQLLAVEQQQAPSGPVGEVQGVVVQ